jgi:hypothetical protein
VTKVTHFVVTKAALLTHMQAVTTKALAVSLELDIKPWSPKKATSFGVAFCLEEADFTPAPG